MGLPSPEELQTEFPVSREARVRIEEFRAAVAAVLAGTDGRLLFLAGPCSVHNREETLDIAGRFAALATETGDRLILAMRVYVEKSRASLGWRGMARDPELDESRGASVGLREARAVLAGVANLGLPVGIELVSPLLWPYWADTLSWASVGPQGVESQALREAAAALPCPCGFKNALSGDPEGAVNACLAASRTTTVLVPGRDGRMDELPAPGNPSVHVVLRGGGGRPNDRRASHAAARMRAAGLAPAVILDASHDNSRGNPRSQRAVILRALRQRARGVPVRGVMLETYLKTGRQNLAPRALLAAGLSVTDPCLGWPETESLVREVYGRLGR